MCDQWKMLQCWRRTGHLPFFFAPPRWIWQLKSPHPKEFATQGPKKCQCPGVSPSGGLGGGVGDWFWIRVRGQFEIKILTVRDHSDINTTVFIWIIGKKETWACDQLELVIGQRNKVDWLNFKKVLDLDGSTLEPTVRSGDTGQRISCFDSCQLITTLMCN